MKKTLLIGESWLARALARPTQIPVQDKLHEVDVDPPNIHRNMVHFIPSFLTINQSNNLFSDMLDNWTYSLRYALQNRMSQIPLWNPTKIAICQGQFW